MCHTVTPQLVRHDLSGLATGGNASFSEQILNITTAQIESLVEPDYITDDFGWKPVTLTGIYHPSIDQPQLSCQYLVNRLGRSALAGAFATTSSAVRIPSIKTCGICSSIILPAST
jgi:hypothetical protein